MIDSLIPTHKLTCQIYLLFFFIVIVITYLLSDIQQQHNQQYNIDKEYPLPQPKHTSWQRGKKRRQQEQEQEQQLYFTERTLSAEFNTSTGYDASGTNIVCWLSTIENNSFAYTNGGINNTGSNISNNDTNTTSSTSSNSSTTVTTDELRQADNVDDESVFYFIDDDDLYYNATENDSTKLLSKCYNGTTMTTVALSESFNVDGFYYTNTSYVVNLTVQTDLSALIGEARQLILKDIIFIRSQYIFCNAIQVGFCHPLRRPNSQIDFTTTTTGNTTNIEPPLTEVRMYKEGQVLQGEVLGMGLVLAPWFGWKLQRISSNSTVYSSSINVSLSLPKGVTPGAYFYVGHSVLSYYDQNDNEAMRFDIADAIPDNIVQLRDKPKIFKLSYGVKIILSCLIGLFACIALGMFIFIIFNRNHIVMQLTQGPFLAAIACSCFIQIIGTVTYFPIYNVFCSINTIITSIPQTFIGAVLIARMWRAYSTLAAANQFARSKRNLTTNNNTSTKMLENCLLSFLNILANPMALLSGVKCITRTSTHRSPSYSQNNYHNINNNNNTLRRTVLARHSIVLIAMLVLPHLIVQIITTIIYDSRVVIQYSEDRLIGREICFRQEMWPVNFSLMYLALIYIIAISIAWISKDLPSVFNEKAEMFAVAFIDAFLVAITLALQQFIANPMTEPNFLVVTNVCLAITMSINALFFVVYPKIRRILKGEKIIVANVLASKCNTHYTPAHYLSATATPTQMSNNTTATTCNNSGTSNVKNNKDSEGNDNVSNCPMTSLAETSATVDARHYHQTIIVRSGDPVPASIEKQLHHLQLFLRDITTHL